MLTAVLRNVLLTRPCGLTFDIDGTLSPIAPTPEAARLFPGVASLLERLRPYARVAVVTGRGITSAAALVGVDEITYIGNHGLEWAEGLPEHHPIRLLPEAEAYRLPAQRLLALAEQHLTLALPCAQIEYKSIGGTIHYRRCPDPVQARQQILELLREPAQESGLLLTEGKMAVELRVPGLNKGQALQRFIEQHQLRSALFAGDDTTDLDGVETLIRLRQEGSCPAAVTIAVRHADTPPLLLERADLVVEGVAGMAALLEEMVIFLEGEAGASSPGWQEKRA
ncbi:MAG: trehalose-phosphatase [Thermogemmatispora sp.]|uniref:trehalose-phosphatase n=1 Tax=Thermogemmatispora sp. TaxID=1968838 RepID=UPI0019F0E2F2|nr:trehalose-phosphatase [Thermogemmatispora sp.]MBE3566549.1 trehalose-phosphatase [Thermogemmatispora sp.]